VEWAARTVRGEEPAIPLLKGCNPIQTDDPDKKEAYAKMREKQLQDPFIAHALNKGWVSKDGSRVLAQGFTVAKGYLKR